MKRTMLIIGLLISALFLVGCNNVDHTKDQCYEEIWPSEDCCEACAKFNYTFLESVYSRGGWGHEMVNKCFCKNNSEVIQLWA